MVRPPKPAHPKGELSEMLKDTLSVTLEVGSFDGKIHVEWEPEASVTPMGQLVFFIQFLKTGHRFERLCCFKRLKMIYWHNRTH